MLFRSLADLDEMAALMCALDGVVTVCTATAHLAGALGRPTLVLVPSVAEWRYLERGEAMPWYPSVRLYRQASGESWSAVVQAVAGELSAAARAANA